MGSKRRMIQLPRGYNKGYDKEVKVTPPISSHSWEQSNLIVCGQTKSTDTHAKSTEKTMEKGSSRKGISEEYQQKLFQTTTCSPQDFPARLLVLLEEERDSKIRGELCSSKYAELRRLRNLVYFCLRTLKGCSITKKGRLSELSSIRFQNWGMTANGRCITARISEYHKTGKECSLSDILEEQVGEKYFLSEKMMKYLRKRMEQTKDYHKPNIIRI